MLVRRRVAGPVESEAHESTVERFREAMEDDFEVAGALGALFEAVREGNRLLDAGDDAGAYIAAYDLIVEVLGIGEPSADLDDLDGPVTALAASVGVEASGVAETIDALLERRQQARSNREFDVADRIRSELSDLGVVVEDAAEGTRWFRQ